METFFNSVHITNFKSLKDVTLSDCKRINLLIGKPNVGKSNILEAIGLLGLGYNQLNNHKKLNSFIRYDNITELFFDGSYAIGEIDNPIMVGVRDDANIIRRICIVRYMGLNLEISTSFTLEGITDRFEVDEHSNITSSIAYDLQNSACYDKLLKVKQYKFTHGLILEKQNLPFLIPPFGVNLLGVIQSNLQLKTDISRILSEYKLKILIDKSNNELRVMKALDEDSFISLPYYSIADTLQRLVFFKTAITSNNNSIILFEEPEAHCFPPYITHIAKEIIDSKSNQFFIATHSPYILDTFLEKVRDDLAIYMADFKDGQTVIKRLTDAEINEVYEYGLDLFFNAELFTDEI
jgi:AAA15 family ATPase/GTPase